MLTRKQVKQIAETISNEELAEMFEAAKIDIRDWTKPSIANSNYSKGWMWNQMARGFDVKLEYAIYTKINMVKEFQKYLPNHLKYLKDKKREPVHQDPEF